MTKMSSKSLAGAAEDFEQKEAKETKKLTALI